MEEGMCGERERSSPIDPKIQGSYTNHDMAKGNFLLFRKEASGDWGVRIVERLGCVGWENVVVE